MSYLDKIKVADETYDIKDSSAAHSVNGQAPDASGNVAVAVPTKTSELENDSNFQNSTQTTATANAAVATHNTSNTAHADIREATSTNSANIDAIQGKIPAQASASNQLADKAFVNSTAQTSSANFRGNWANWAAVPTNADDYPVDADGNKTPTKNDYLVVQDASDYAATTLTGTWRFKYSGEWATDGKAGWHPEYQVNETPLTAAQLAALNSGATAALMAKLNDIPADAEANEIDSISVNGTAVTPDENKNVALTIPDGIKTLTTADYNYPTTGTKTTVALWLLDSGYYKIPAGVNWRVTNSDITREAVAIVGTNDSGVRPVIVIEGGGNVWAGASSGAATMNAFKGTCRLLTASDTKNNLTTENTAAGRTSPLSAHQGKVLNERIGDLTTLTTTAKTSAVAAINELNTSAVGTTETLTIADTDWSALSSSDPYDCSATKTLTATIGANSTVELINDAAVDFATYGFAIGAVDTANNTVTFYSIGAPSASKTLKVNVKG